MGVDYILYTPHHKAWLEIPRWMGREVSSEKKVPEEGVYYFSDLWKGDVAVEREILSKGLNLITRESVESLQLEVAQGLEEKDIYWQDFNQDIEAVLRGTAWPFLGLYHWLDDFQDPYTVCVADYHDTYFQVKRLYRQKGCTLYIGESTAPKGYLPVPGNIALSHPGTRLPGIS